MRSQCSSKDVLVVDEIDCVRLMIGITEVVLTIDEARSVAEHLLAAAGRCANA